MAIFSGSVFSPSVYDVCNIPTPTTPSGGSLGWYYNGWPKSKQKQADKVIDKIAEVLGETAFLSPEIIEGQSFEAQKEQIAQNIINSFLIEDLFRHHEIQALIQEAQIEYYQNLAKLREQDDEAALMLLLN